MDIIQDIEKIGWEFIAKVCDRFLSGGFHDLSQLTTLTLEDCKDTAAAIIEAGICTLNSEMRTDKESRRKEGLVMKEHDRTRTILTEIGELKIQRDYYHDKKSGKYCFPMDDILGLPKYERVDRELEKHLVEEAARVSYANSARIVTGGTVSRQTVRNCILKTKVPEEALPSHKRMVETLHLFADEDHVHLQRPDKARGKRSQIVPIVTVTEGIRSVWGRRHETIEATSFVDEEFDTHRLWKRVEGYIEQKYDLEVLKEIVIHGDGGQWIRKGMDEFEGVVRVMDGFHFQKYIRSLCRCLPKRNIRVSIMDSVKKNDRDKADRYLQKLMRDEEKNRKKIQRFSGYLMKNWEAIVNQFQEGMTGSCTEGLVSHLLSERFSRDPQGWGKRGLGRLSHLRIYLMNGGKLTRDDLKGTDGSTHPASRYAEYADRLAKKVESERKDWSIFDGRSNIFDGASGTQTEIRNYGRMRSLLS